MKVELTKFKDGSVVAKIINQCQICGKTTVYEINSFGAAAMIAKEAGLKNVSTERYSDKTIYTYA